MRCSEKVSYDSEMLASNGAWLHGAVFTRCAGVTVYACGDHWHYGHGTPAASAACQAVHLPPRWRPARVSGTRRHPTRRQADRVSGTPPGQGPWR